MMSAIQCHPKLRPMYERLVVSGKRKKMAIDAGMRKQLTILNTMAKMGLIGIKTRPKAWLGTMITC